MEKEIAIGKRISDGADQKTAGSLNHVADVSGDRIESAHKGLKIRPKTALRLKYEAETQLIRRKLGDLESIRQQLGLSQRKLCQLLLVDPSAWTRWTRDGDDAPPHIYRMLQWYLALNEKYPALDVNFWLSTVSRVRDDADSQGVTKRLSHLSARTKQNESRIEARFQELTREIAGLKRQLEEERARKPRKKSDGAKSKKTSLWSRLLKGKN